MVQINGESLYCEYKIGESLKSYLHHKYSFERGCENVHFFAANAFENNELISRILCMVPQIARQWIHKWGKGRIDQLVISMKEEYIERLKR
jgi:hypothetical protein